MKSSITPTLAVADIDRSVRFYDDVLGFSTTFTLPGPDGTLGHASLDRGDASLMFGRLDPSNPHDEAPLGRGVTLYLTIGDDEDIDAAFAHAQASGSSVVQEPTDQFWGMRDWGITDPDGYVVMVSKVTGTPSEAEMRAGLLAGAPAD